MARQIKEMEWFCVTNNYATDAKVDYLTEHMGNEGERLWIRIMALASQTGAGVVHVTDGIPMSAAKIASVTRSDEATIIVFLQLCEELGMIAYNYYGGIILTNWDRYQHDKYKLGERNAAQADYMRRKRAGEFGTDEHGKPLGKNGKKPLSPQAKKALAKAEARGYNSGLSDGGYIKEEHAETVRRLDDEAQADFDAGEALINKLKKKLNKFGDVIDAGGWKQQRLNTEGGLEFFETPDEAEMEMIDDVPF